MTRNKQDKITESADGTRGLAEMAKKFRGGDVVLLMGELGVGKTVLAQGIASSLGVKEKVTSPTFTVVGEYQTQSDAIKTLVHVDLYRLPDGQVDKDVAVGDALERIGDEGRLTVIEWADKLRGELRGRVWRVSMEHGGVPEERIIRIISPGE